MTNEKKVSKISKFFRNFYPTYTFDKVENIPYDLLKELGIKLILLDMDNTLIDNRGNYSKDLKKWIKYIKSKGIKTYILSNSISETRVKKIAKELGMKYYYKASKPRLKGYHHIINETKIDKEMDMIDTNIKGAHTLTKLFLKDFKDRNRGYILNVSSSAAFLSGPLMSTYYATKVYVLHLTEAINEELRRENSNVYIGVLCPGPVDTNFNKIAGVEFNLKSMTSSAVAKYAIDKMFKRKMLIIPGIKIKLGVFITRLLPRKLMTKISYGIQKKKIK